jgi:hypothetical protein
MISLSDEQKYILKKVKSGKNVIVDAVAGTGKTTLILSISKKLAKKNILQMTYNSSLRSDVNSKIKEMNLENIKIHTFHSLAVRYYESNAFTDTELRRILFKNTPPKVQISVFDLLVLDECQDMTFLYFQFMVKFVRDMGSQIQLLILGDYMQGLYDFKGADIRFLTMGEIIWKDFNLLKKKTFEKCTMKMSFRITNQICSFVNEAMLGEDRMQACRDDEPVVYIRNSRENIEKIVTAEIYKLFEKGVKPSEIFILGSSVKGINSNIRKLENKLVMKNIPCHVPMMENDKIDDRVIEGKVVFSTFHCVKGRQRKYVFVVGFDNSYHRFFERNKPSNICPNTIYVAVTRAEKRLYLLENNQYPEDRPFKFLKMSHVDMKKQDYIEFRGIQQTNFIELDESMNLKTITRRITPSELIKFIPEIVIEELTPLIEKIFVVEKKEQYEIEIPSVIKTKNGYFEEVSDLNGIAIPSMYYDYLFNYKISKNETSSQETENNNEEKYNILLELIKKNMDTMKKNEHIFLKEIVETLPKKIENIDEYLYMANINMAIQEKLYFKLKQIDRDEYNWLNEDVLLKSRERMEQIIGVDCVKQEPRIEEVIIFNDDELHVKIDEFFKPIYGNTKRFRFHARIDLITDNNVWELKCTSKLTIEYYLQVVIYAWLWKMRTNIYYQDDEGNKMEEEDKKKDFKLFNIKTGEILRLDAKMEELDRIMLALIEGKYKEEVIKTDEEFVEECKKYIMSM